MSADFLLNLSTHNGQKNNTLEEISLELILSNLVTEEFSVPISGYERHNAQHTFAISNQRVQCNEDCTYDSSSEKNDIINNSTHFERYKFTHIAPCHSERCVYVQESTSALLAARALAKAGHSSKAWEILEYIFTSQGSNGILPKYIYDDSKVFPLQRTNETIKNSSRYIPGTCLPSSRLFGMVPPSYQPLLTSISQRIGIASSGRITSPPFHARIVLDVFYLSNQTEHDVKSLARYSKKLYNWHGFLHQDVMRGCPIIASSNEKEIPKVSYASELPCYNIIHPWESMIDSSSPIWKSIFEILNLEQEIKEKNWTPDFSIPKEVKNSPNYPGASMYNITLYLLECLSKTIDINVADDKNLMDRKSSDYENQILQKCPFAMLDVGYASALAKSDESLLEISKILVQKDFPQQPSPAQMNNMKKWWNQSNFILKSTLWNEKYQSFLPNLIVEEKKKLEASYLPTDTMFTKKAPSKWKGSEKKKTFSDASLLSSYSSRSLPVPIVDNFMALYGTIKLDNQKIQSTAFSLLQSEGKFSFNCGNFPIYSIGGCDLKELDQALISPLYNYYIAKGFHQNNEIALSHFLQMSTLNLICSLPNTNNDNFSDNCLEKRVFANAYNATSHFPILGSFSNLACSNSSTLTAAVVYNLLIPDIPFQYEPAPPLPNYWVFALIATELFVALSIGIGCIVLSLNLIQKLKVDKEEDTFVRLNKDEMLQYIKPNSSVIFGKDQPVKGNSAQSLKSEGTYLILE